MAERNLNLLELGEVIAIKGQNVQEEMEEIELDPLATGVLEQLVLRGNDGSQLDDDGRQILNLDGNSYAIEGAYEIELVQLEGVPANGGEVEIVAVDSNDYTHQGQEQALFQYNEFLSRLQNAPVAKSRPEQKLFATPSVPKLKNTPALLRRGLISSRGSETATSQVKSKGSDSPQSSQNLPECASASIIRKFSGKKSQETPSTTQNAPGVYFVYQDSADDQGGQNMTPVGMNFMYNIGSNSSLPTILIQQGPIGEIQTISSTKVVKKKSPKKPRPPSKSQKKKVKEGKKSNVAELKCLEDGCGVTTCNVLELRKHLTKVHDMILDYDSIMFQSDAGFKEWRQQYERERMVSFIYRGGTKKISSEQSVTYMVCHRSGHYKPTMKDESKRKRKMKPQGSCKIGGYCTAGIKLLRNLSTKEIKMEICHTHYGHPLDSEAIPHLRVNPGLRKIIQKKFEDGMSFTDMLEYIHHNPDRLEGLRMVDRRAVRNIYDSWRHSGAEEKNPHKDNTDVQASPTNDDTVDSSNMLLDEMPGSNSSVSNDAPILLPVDEWDNTTDKDILDNSNPPKLIAVESLAFSSKDQCQGTKRKHPESKLTDGKRRKIAPEAEVENKEEQQTASCSSQIDESDPLDTSVDCDPSVEEDFGLMQIRISPALESKIAKLHDHGESGPTILLYKKAGDVNVKYGAASRAFREDDFCLIIQTPVQRQILQMFPKILNFEILDRAKPKEHDLKLGYLSVLDGFREAIPVAWIIADSMCPRIFNQLFKTLKSHCGELAVHYIMAPKNAEVLKSFTSNFSHKPKIIQNEFSARRDLRSLLNRHIPNDDVRIGAWSLLEDAIFTKSKPSLIDLKDKLKKLMKPHPNGAAYMRKMEKDWLPRKEEWSFAYRIGATSNLLFVSDSFLRLRKFVSFKGTKHLNQTIDDILKIGYDKCFLRTKRMFKGDQKFSKVLENIEMLHKSVGEKLKNCTITEEDDQWTIEWLREEDNEVEKEEVCEINSPCDCKIICKLCNICMHKYLCTCEDFKNNHLMCVHIHKVHCFRNGIMDEEIIESVAEVEVIEEPTKHESILPGGIDDGTEIEFITADSIDGMNLTEVLQASGLLSGGGETKIVSITDTSDDRIIYDGSEGGSIIFRFGE